MPVYLGSLGRMVKLPYVGSQQVQSEERYNFSSTLEGKRKAQVKPRGPRTWALSADHFRPNEHSLLSQFADGAWGNGPFVFVSADAPVSNMLTPEVSTCGPDAVIASTVAVAGPWDLGGGVFASRSLMNVGGAASIYFGDVPSPVVVGVSVTGSAWVGGVGARVRLNWADVTGAFIGSSVSSAAPSSSPVRLHVTGVPPVGAVGCVLSAVGASRAAQPAVIWSEAVLPWSDGQGCDKGVVHNVTRDQVLAVQGHTYSNVGFTVSEVG